jgi:hypothetical protein
MKTKTSALTALVDGRPVITPEPNSGMSERREIL